MNTQVQLSHTQDQQQIKQHKNTVKSIQDIIERHFNNISHYNIEIITNCIQELSNTFGVEQSLIYRSRRVLSGCFVHLVDIKEELLTNTLYSIQDLDNAKNQLENIV